MQIASQLLMQRLDYYTIFLVLHPSFKIRNFVLIVVERGTTSRILTHFHQIPQIASSLHDVASQKL